LRRGEEESEDGRRGGTPAFSEVWQTKDLSCLDWKCGNEGTYGRIWQKCGKQKTCVWEAIEVSETRVTKERDSSEDR